MPEISAWVLGFKRVNALKGDNSSFDNQMAEAAVVSGRKYFLEELGGTQEELLEQKNKQKQLANHPAILFPAPRPQIFSWFDILSSNQPDVVPISNGENAFLFLDEDFLLAQGCTAEMIRRAYVAPRFHGDCIKTLTGVSTPCFIKLHPSLDAQETFVEFELKVSDMARILLCPIRDKRHRATVYVSYKFLDEGLHNTGSQRSLAQSLQSQEEVVLNVRKQSLQAEI